jgi:hypothetical protein
MSSSIILDNTTQKRLESFAKSHGLNTHAEAIVTLLNASSVEVLPEPSALPSEENILQRLSTGLPEAFWQRKNVLDHRAQQHLLTEEEYTERVALCTQLEQWQASLLEEVFTLAQQRQESPYTIMRRLGLPIRQKETA